jgi:anti-sigma-K factor RskA
MTHDELRDLIAAYALGTATRAERAALEAHISGCAECRAEVASLAPVVQGLAHAAPLLEAPAGLRGRVLMAATGGSMHASVAGAEREPGFGWRTAAGLAALLVIGAGVYALSLQMRLAALQLELREVAAAAARAEEQVAELGRTAAERESALRVLGAVDLARIDLRAEPAAPGARARAFWNRSTGLVFTASDLPAPPEGKAYQLWVLTSGSPISAGLIQPDERGSVDAVIETPQDLPAPVGMAVTIEPAGGVPAPTGERVLLGLAAG